MMMPTTTWNAVQIASSHTVADRHDALGQGSSPTDRRVARPRSPVQTRVGLSMIGNRPVNAVAREVRRELLSELPYYTVFDWLEFEVLPGNTVVLRGEVTTPPDTKSRAEAVVKDVPGVSRVVNEIRVLPVSPQ